MKLSCEPNFFSITQRINIIKTYYKNDASATATYRALSEDYGLHNRPTTQAIGKIVGKFEETGVLINIDRQVNHRFARSAENNAIISESVAQDRNVSIRSIQESELSYGTLRSILHSDLHLHTYKVQLTQQLK